MTDKTKAVSVSIPYKYVVYKGKKRKYEYEFIYKENKTDQHTNRCLFVKPQLINEGRKGTGTSTCSHTASTLHSLRVSCDVSNDL